MNMENILIKHLNKPVAVLILITSHLPIIFITLLLLLFLISPPGGEVYVSIFYLLGFSAMASLVVGFSYYNKSIWSDSALMLHQKIKRFGLLYLLMPLGVFLLYWDELRRKQQVED